MRFTSKKERYEWMKRNSPKMVEDLQRFKEAFGCILLSNVVLLTEEEKRGTSDVE